MKKIRLLFIFILCISIFSCKKSNRKITNQTDYNAFLAASEDPIIIQTHKELKFWNSKLDKDSVRIKPLSEIAKRYTSLFQSTGKIEYLKKAELMLVRASQIANIGKENYILSLARNYITQHRFKEAEKLALEVHQSKMNPKVSAMILFDISMELGKYNEAERYLKDLQDENDYNFLIRLAKWQDYKGNLDATILYMEKAEKIAENSNNKNLILWSYTNLADFYGHAGRVQDSYNYYLKALEIDPYNAYARKGIAWIAYSYENNPDEALRILNVISKNYVSPDQILLMAEISSYMSNEEIRKTFISTYEVAMQNPDYGVMYNTYNINLYAEELEKYELALKLANEEVYNRPTPESFDLLAYTHYLMGDYKKALSILETEVQGNTFEPEVLYHTALILKANNMDAKVAELKEELLKSSFELGPVIMNQVKLL